MHVSQQGFCNTAYDRLVAVLPANQIPRLKILINLHGPLTRCAKLWVAHALGMPGTASPPSVMHVGIAN